ARPPWEEKKGPILPGARVGGSAGWQRVRVHGGVHNWSVCAHVGRADQIDAQVGSKAGAPGHGRP
ncbi:MAG: hypothetical protein V2B18_05575, partial [Pseudomonadota bacterium]